MHYAKFTCVLNRMLFSYAIYPRKHANNIFKTLFIKTALYLGAFDIGGQTFRPVSSRVIP